LVRRFAYRREAGTGIHMKDLNAELEKLLLNAEDCELIARLATDRAKRETFSRIAKQLREMAAELMADIAARSARVS
jgi:SepF-like predicted cell division protein (DUF552 family)